MDHCKDCKWWGEPQYLNEERNGITFRACAAVQEAPTGPHSSAESKWHAEKVAEQEAFDKALTTNEFYIDDVELSGCSTLRTGPEFGCVNFEKKE